MRRDDGLGYHFLLPAAHRTLCGVPNCTDAALNASLGGTLTCADIPATPNVQTAWEVTTDLGESLCKLKVTSHDVITWCHGMAWHGMA